MQNKITLIFTIIILLISFITDIKTRKIYNIITFPSIITGLIISAVFHDGLLLYRIIWLFAFYFIGTLGMMGMGDLKLIMSIIALRGIGEAAYSLLFGSLLLLIYCLITNHKVMIETLKDTLHYIVLHTPMPKRSDTKYPLASFIALGYGVYWLLIICLSICVG